MLWKVNYSDVVFVNTVCITLVALLLTKAIQMLFNARLILKQRLLVYRLGLCRSLSSRISLGSTDLVLAPNFQLNVTTLRSAYLRAVRLSSVVCHLSSVTLLHPAQRLELFDNTFAPSKSTKTPTVSIKISGKCSKGLQRNCKLNTRGYERLTFSTNISLYFNKNLAIVNRSRVSCAHNVEGICDNPVTLKYRLRVVQGHWKRNHWTDHARLTISLVI